MKLGRTIPYLLVLVAVFFARHNPFFWDTVQLASKHAHYFYETDFQSIILPEVIDSGHPPAFGAYLAAVWKIFGKSLPASHFAMLPFLWGIVFFLLKFGEKLAGKGQAHWLLLLCFADPVLASQSILVSPDVVLVCFFLMALWAIWEQRPGWLVLAVAGLGLVSMRGMMLAVGLYFFSIFVAEKISWKTAAQKILPFVPGGLLAAAYLFYHWQQTGWVGFHENSTWAPSFQRVDFQGFVKNLALLGWRLLDFGRVFVWVGLAVPGWFLIKKSSWKWATFSRKSLGWQLMALAILTFLALVPSQLFYKGLLAHRYLLPVFLALNFLVFYLFKTSRGKGFRLTLALKFLLLVGLASGNFWVYPKKISQGWDSTLAHLPWYWLQEQVENFIQKSGIAYGKIGTAFPNIGPREAIELNRVGDGFAEKNLKTNCYVFYSNIMNDFTNEEIDELEGRWEPVFSEKKRGVCVILYKNPNPGTCGN
ncbi:MAG: hypothetical protein HY842_08310 [Bacteroidetes bacterium]|nr:hypothetical protein [Bacteroidota bacterium]